MTNILKIMKNILDLSGCPQENLLDGKIGMLENQIIMSKKIQTSLPKFCFIFLYFRYEGGEREHCLELWNRDGKVNLKYDTFCYLFFIF